MESKKRILIIDDEEDFCFFVKGNLERTGEFDVLATSSGKEGIKLARAEKPDLIFLDLNMPGMPGDEVAQTLFERADTQAIPLVFLTALVTKDEMGQDNMASIGGYDYIAKPVTTRELVSVIREILV